MAADTANVEAVTTDKASTGDEVAAVTGDNNNLIILVTLMTFMLAIMGVSYKMLKEK